MHILYASKTGNVRRFIVKTGFSALCIDENPLVEQPFVLVTYTTGFGQVPDQVTQFLQRNHRFLFAVAASGNKNWGEGFARSADIIAEKYGVPILCKFEMSGTKGDVEIFNERMRGIEETVETY
ncbi:MAG: class Ib ribonucleoside-diphosphate reductase assembly flavoprotein NrdI [Firmicutes bacterium]|uniref:Protein NrdI n=1 Tax=Melghirimyces thermohalophilus TaxID=1236220 RepID=A0A1G6NMA0_9BACL|nr:class Ib ribonucleoside-diphosphate reductase assembly flavoprotein NrdI [Melghirimyces thermohalophilus]MDA8353890.1 class Ib ribonucleoside-diphosphate reductase assembly flavoprotein NrdI [Bacillota bacterium]SDC69070.1 protein involved in ribonucleotide reduction [Melghirimyces thermohalophilus]